MNPLVDSRTPEQWSKFCNCPFNEEDGYTCYVAELAKIDVTYKTLMLAKNSDGVSALQVLKNGASRQHYEALHNSSRLLARLGVKAARLGVGTTRNEQLHRELKGWMRNIILSHEQRIQTGFRIFVFAKMITHSSASYFSTLVQLSQSRLLHSIASKLRVVRFFPTPGHPAISIVPTPSSRMIINKPSILKDTDLTISRLSKRKRQLSKWKTRDASTRTRRHSSTDVFRRPRIDKRPRAFSKKEN